MAEKCSGTGAMLSFLAGAAIGTGLALLYAPKTGKEVRGRITDFSNETVSKMKGYGSQAQEKMKGYYNAGRDMFREKKEQMSSSMESGEEPLGRA